MSNKYLFATTRSDSTFYDLIQNGMKIHAEKKLKSKLDIFYIKKKFPSIRFIIFFILRVLSVRNISDKNFISLKYRDCSIGRHSFSYAMRQNNSYKNKIFKNYYKFKALFLGGSIIDTANRIPQFIEAAYFDHGVYLNGLYIEVFIKKKKIIYTNNWPRGLTCSDFRNKKPKKLFYEDLIRISKTKNPPLLNVKKKKLFIHKKITNPKSYEWLKIVNFNKLKKGINYDEYKYIIYPQGFSDAQLLFGFTGFPTIRDWFEFHLDFFAKKNIKLLVKPHPNFYDIKTLDEKDIDKKFKVLSKLDHVMFNEIKKNYSKFNNITFLNEPYPNHLFLKKLNNKKHILLFSHTSAILESAYYGFKCITAKPMWSEDFKITNVFKSQFELEKLLSANFDKLIFPNKNDLFEVAKQFYLNPYGYFGNNHIKVPFKKILGFKEIYKFGYEAKIHEMLQKKPYKKNMLINKISNCIQDL